MIFVSFCCLTYFQRRLLTELLKCITRQKHGTTHVHLSRGTGNYEIAHSGKMRSPLDDRYLSALIAQRLARSLRKRKVPDSVGKNFSFCNYLFALITGRVSPWK